MKGNVNLNVILKMKWKKKKEKPNAILFYCCSILLSSFYSLINVISIKSLLIHFSLYHSFQFELFKVITSSAGNRRTCFLIGKNNIYIAISISSFCGKSFYFLINFKHPNLMAICDSIDVLRVLWEWCCML